MQEKCLTLKTRLESVHSSKDSPPRCVNALSILFNNKLYILSSSTTQPIRSLTLHQYSLHSKKWNTVQIYSSSTDLEMLEPHCGALANQNWFIFGTMTYPDHIISSVWKINLDQMMWTPVSHKGEVPSADDGCLVSYDDSWLVFYGGSSSYKICFSNSLYVFNINSKYWYECQANYDLIKSREGSSLCVSKNGRLYLFGGAYDGSQGIEYLNDLYEITIAFPFKGSPARAVIKRISTQEGPKGIATHSLFAIGCHYLGVFGGISNQQATSDLWILNITKNNWVNHSNAALRRINPFGYSCTYDAGSLYILGGISLDEEERCRQIINDLWIVQINGVNPSASYITIQQDNCCNLCFQNTHDFVQNSPQFSSHSMENLVQMIDFPFAAFGLLIDNCIILGATVINICIEGPPTNYVIRVQDNGKFLWTQQQFIESLCYLQSSSNMILVGCEKKIKRSIVKQNIRRQFGSNLKIGSLRWGSEFLYINCMVQQIRVYLCFKPLQSQNISQNYTFHYYSFNPTTKLLIDQANRASRNFIEQTYGKYVRDVLGRRKTSNTLYIFDTILNKSTENIRVTEQNDVILGNEQHLKTLQKIGYPIRQSIDISLKSYLSFLFLKNEGLTLSLGVKNQLNPLFIQAKLEKVDRLCRLKTVVDLQSIIDFDFKTAEFFYLRQIKKQNNFLSNGLLLYSKNRLIKRYKPKLGTIVTTILTDPCSNYYSHLPFFGFAELPETLPVNIFKTDFAFPAMMDKLQSRIKFVDQNFKNRSKILAPYLEYSWLQRPKQAIERYEFPKKRNRPTRSYDERVYQTRRMATSSGKSFRNQIGEFKRKNAKNIVESMDSPQIPKQKLISKFKSSFQMDDE